MTTRLERKFTIADLRAAREKGTKVPMLTCYDHSLARVMDQSGVPMILVGDSAANVMLGHESTVPISLEFLIEITAAVRRGAHNAMVIADMPFGSYGGTVEHGFSNATRLLKLSGADCVKLEVAGGHEPLIRALADSGVAVMAHVGLRPQTVGVLGGYRFQGRTAEEARAIVELARMMERAGASALLIEAVPPQVSQRVVDTVSVPVIGCGAGPACHGHVIVTHDGLGLTPHRPRFVPQLADVTGVLSSAIGKYVEMVRSGNYPADQHNYGMPPEELEKFSR